MNQRNREQLRAAIVDNLNQGKQTHSPTRDLLKQYRPLKGILASAIENAHTQSASDLTKPVEKSMAPDATLAQQEGSPWHGATLVADARKASPATVECYAEVKGELRVSNTINFGLFPTLDPFARAVYYQLYLLAHGFRRETCTVGLAKLAKSILMSQRKLQATICYLEKRKLIQREGAKLGGSLKGNIYRVFLPNTMARDATTAEDATVGPSATLASNATNKDAAVRLKPERSDLLSQRTHLSQTRETYCRVTGNKWTEADGTSYCQNSIADILIDKVISTIETISHRAAAKVNSFNYFVKEILAVSNPRTRMFEKKQLERVARRVRENHVGSATYSFSDFFEDVKPACSREGVRFDEDLLSELYP